MNTCINSERISKWMEQYGSPLYVFDEGEFIENFKHLLTAFRRIYPKYNIAYSYKTNYTPYVCKLVKELGGYAEVVSSMEYWLAKKIGYKSDRIIYNGPVKGELIFEQLREGGVVNVDNLEELSTIVEFMSNEPNRKYKLAFRVNIDIDQGFISRFGIDSENGDLDKAFSVLKEIPNVSVEGIHCHVGRSRAIASWEKRVEKIFSIVEKYFQVPPRFIDLGSGMYSVMEPELALQFGSNIPNYEDYAAAVAKLFVKKYGSLPMEEQPELITEPGTTVISKYISFMTKVLSIKEVKGKIIATFDGSIGNMGDICKLKQLPISVFTKSNNLMQYENVDFVGYTCLEHDVMYKDYTGELAIGDVVQFRNVGSYSNVFKPPFIAPNCAMIVVNADGKESLIKRKETYEDIFETYVF